MSIELMESWIMFARGTYASSAGAGVGFAEYSGPLAWSPNSWKTYVASGGLNTAPFFHTRIVADPVFANRNRLQMAVSVGGGNTGVVGMIRRVSSYAGTRRIGFLLRMLPTTSETQLNIDPGTATRAAAAHPVIAGLQSLISFYLAPSSTTVKLSHSGTGTAVALATTLVTDVDYYIEIELNTSAGTYRVWVNDFLYVDAALSAAAKAAYTDSWGFRVETGAVALAGTVIPIGMISDIYVLKDDGVAPSGRLGRNTRVKGELPTSDVRADFTRPAGYNSNWSVVDNQISSASTPTDYLIAGAVGARDLYTSSTDPSYAQVIHGVSVKAVMANMSSSASVVSAVHSDGVNTRLVPLASLSAGVGFAGYKAETTLGPGGVAFTPDTIANVAFGVEITS